MDAFEQLVAELLFAEGFWVEPSVKVVLTKEDKQRIGRPSCPRWELDLVAYKPVPNELLVIECKSFLDSTGVQYVELQDGHPSTKYKLFRDPELREVILARLCQQMIEEGRCGPGVSARLGMACGKIRKGDAERLEQHFAERDWILYRPDWLREKLEGLSKASYANQVSSVVAKLLLRQGGASPMKSGFAEPNPRRVAISRSTPIKLLVSHNPKRQPSLSYERFQNYLVHAPTTVAEALDCGIRMDDIRNDSRRGYIELG